MSSYPAGSDTEFAPWNQVVTGQDVRCSDEDCGHVNVDTEVSWRGSIGTAECEKCGAEIEIEALTRFDYEGD